MTLVKSSEFSGGNFFYASLSHKFFSYLILNSQSHFVGFQTRLGIVKSSRRLKKNTLAKLGGGLALSSDVRNVNIAKRNYLKLKCFTFPSIHVPFFI